MTGGLFARCRAKVNLTLEVLARRPDGYHEVASLVAAISLSDTLEVRPADHLTCEVEGIDLADEENLVLRAARLLSEAARVPPRANLRLSKGIPAAAGLGGGSSDAAATLLALDRLWGTRLGRARLAALAAQLGSDVPFFLHGGVAAVGGRGEQVHRLPPMPTTWLVLLVPSHSLAEKTAALYRALRPEDFGAGVRTMDAEARVGAGLPLRDADLANAFTRAARESFSGLDHLWREAEAGTGRKFHLSGAGPALFALARGRQDARALEQRLRGPGADVYVARTVASGCTVRPLSRAGPAGGA